MNWLASLFSTGNNVSSRRGQAMSTTHEAFSLPTSSPGFATHPDAFNPDSLQTPDTESAMSPSYTYPPQSPISAYGYVPASSGSRSRPTSLLPLHNTPYANSLTPHTSYPPLSLTWNRLKIWLAREYPELGDTFNYGILPQDLAQIEMQFGFPLPSAIRDSYLCVDGQEAESSAGCSEGLFFGLNLLPLEDVLEEWRFWREVDDDPATGGNQRLREQMRSIPDGWIRKEYSQRGWIPLVVDKAGNYIGVDLNPGEGGSVGQVIVFGRDFDTKVVLWRGDGQDGWATWLASFADELESGEGFELGIGSETEGSEDDLGYEAYFYDGSGRGQGDGGGEAGAGGLRLTGEYRGWNVLEAWADRSVKKWYESGIIQDISSLSQEKGKGPENHGLGVLNVAGQSQESSAEVHIPVFSDAARDSSCEDTAGTVTLNAVPAISVTKPPAPLPVGLPTVNDVVPLPSPPDSTHSSIDVDLEAGRSMREVPRQTLVAAASRKRNPNPDAKVENNAPTLISLPTSPDTLPSDASGLSSPPVAPLADITDLLVDPVPSSSTPLVGTPSPILQSESKLITPTSTGEVIPSESVDPPQHFILESQSDMLAHETDATIRLVGGGGSSGLVDEEVLAEDATPPPQAEVTSTTPPAVEESPSKKDKKHDKNKSSLSSGLKKIGQLGGGGKRKKSSGGSIKEVV
ncbi:hypothetical protein SERLA73DRAFT_170616 [Serpula lacrymans var. lacrymans S7.3]|uniref:Knr4/Smi1-like domain-containing protein n=2 Tax=Serpula lacrymans var. lacrymans TaxID=341189 RepID=F8Q6G9_SERL3|nr:uncharacterized protein SERLADRAFT_451763 [Serpula lacrymans var. lacrymans S7.9]EGN96207.1 hypothetical protein SERLA73DRAFT_170616 [Serpula lacrymans var. lacrymans S7.3]EGO21747.1 hypothetical protein SERLADRAFT_451763 [Serpula lacrymans var. lacrymans S7.9]